MARRPNCRSTGATSRPPTMRPNWYSLLCRSQWSMLCLSRSSTTSRNRFPMSCPNRSPMPSRSPHSFPLRRHCRLLHRRKDTLPWKTRVARVEATRRFYRPVVAIVASGAIGAWCLSTRSDRRRQSEHEQTLRCNRHLLNARVVLRLTITDKRTNRRSQRVNLLNGTRRTQQTNRQHSNAARGAQ
jgi:hypothetical protein